MTAETQIRVDAERPVIRPSPPASRRPEESRKRSSESSEPAVSRAPWWAVIGIFVFLLVGALSLARVFLTPIILGFLFSLVFSPIRRLAERTGMSSGVAACGIVFSLVAVLVLIFGLLASPVNGWIQDAPTIGAKLEQRVREIRMSLGGANDGESVSEIVEDVEDAAMLSEQDVQEVVVKDQSYLGMLVSSAPAVVVQACLVLILLLFILASGDMFYEKLVHVLPTFRDKRRAITIAHDVERKLSRYLLTITVINAALGASVGVAMWALGMPDPLLIGMVAWLFNYVPYIGAVAGSGLALIVGLLTFDGFASAVAPAAAYYALTAIEGQFVTPYFVGRNLKLNTVVVFIAVTFWAWLWSIVGMLIAVPMLVTFRTVCEHIPQLEPYGDFLSARGAELDANSPADECRSADVGNDPGLVD